MDIKLIAFAGPMASGKDTLATEIAKHIEKPVIFLSFGKALKDELNLLLSYLRQIHKTYRRTEREKLKRFIVSNFKVNIETIDYLLDYTKPMFQSTPNFEVNTDYKTKEIRYLLQYWGTEIRRKQNPNHWIRLTEKDIQNAINLEQFPIVTDVRFVNEMKCIKNNQGFLIYLNISEKERMKRIKKRDGFMPSLEELRHSSELHYKEFHDYDLILSDDNESIESQTKTILNALCLT